MPISKNDVLRRIDRMCVPDGGVAANEGDLADPMTTAQILVLASDFPEIRELMGGRFNTAVAYLWDQQQQDGRWLREGDDWHTSITAWSVLALSSSADASRGSLEAGVAWLSERRTADGGFSQSDAEPEPNTYSTSYATAALHAAHGPQHLIDGGVTWLRRRQDLEGGFGDSYSIQNGSDPSLTAYVAHALSRLPDTSTGDCIERCALFIAASQRPSGAWEAWYEGTDSMEGTAASLRVLLQTPEKHAKQITSGFEFLSNAADIDSLENWIVVSLAYLALGDNVGRMDTQS